MNLAEAERYEAQVKEMIRQVRLWRAGHPAVIIQFQQPVEVQFALSLAAALDTGMASANKETMVMFRDLDWLHDGKTAPTPFMTQLALELSCKEPVL